MKYSVLMVNKSRLASSVTATLMKHFYILKGNKMLISHGILHILCKHRDRVLTAENALVYAELCCIQCVTTTGLMATLV